MKNEENINLEQAEKTIETIPTPLKKRGRPKKEKTEKEIQDDGLIQERKEAGIIEKKEKDKIKEIKKVLDKEFGTKVEVSETLDDKLSLAEDRLKEVNGIIKELKENAKKNIEEFNSLFKSENIMSNLINKMWWEADRYDELNEEIVFLESELKRAEESKKEFESEIKALKKNIKERDFEEGRKKSKIIKEEDIVKIENAEEKLKELRYAEDEEEFVGLEKRMDEIIKEQDVLKINKEKFSEEEYNKKQSILQEEFDRLGEEIAKRLKEVDVL